MPLALDVVEAPADGPLSWAELRCTDLHHFQSRMLAAGTHYGCSVQLLTQALLIAKAYPEAVLRMRCPLQKTSKAKRDLDSGPDVVLQD